MARNKLIAGLGALAMAATMACNADRAPVVPPAGAPLAPAQVSASRAAAQPGRPEAIGEATAILRDTPLAEDITVSQVIGADGGQLEIPEAGLRLEVPRGAVDAPTTFTATALKGDMVAYEFGPDGSRFSVPLLVLQDTRNTNVDRLPAPALATVQAGYFTGPDMLDRTTKRARLAEVLPTHGQKVGGDVGFLVRHFSGYIIHWGFKPGRAAEQD